MEFMSGKSAVSWSEFHMRIRQNLAIHGHERSER